MTKYEISSARTSFGTLAQYLTVGDVLRRGGMDLVVTRPPSGGTLITVDVETLAGDKHPRLEFYDENVTIR